MMFKPLAIYIGLRYLRSKRRNGFIGFIALASMLGIALGIAVLITVLSVMNGFDAQTSDQLFSLSPAVTINGMNDKLTNWPALVKTVQVGQKTVLAAAPFVYGEGLMRFNASVQPTMVWGVLPATETQVTALNKSLLVGKLTDLTPSSFNVILGQALANHLGVTVGDKVTLMISRVAASSGRITPLVKPCIVVGLFHAGNAFGFDSRFAYINLQDAQKLFLLGDAVSGLHLKLADRYAAPALSEQLQGLLPQTYVSNWTQQYGAFFKAVQLEKTMLFLILTLIIMVAAFNLVSMLVMVVTDKRADIAILRTLGVTPTTIMHIFMVQGILIGAMGTLLGLVIGVTLTLNVSQIVQGIEWLIHMQLFSASVYYLDYLPSKLLLSDVLQVCGTSFILSLLATLYPAWKASRIQPAEALRYE